MPLARLVVVSLVLILTGCDGGDPKSAPVNHPPRAAPDSAHTRPGVAIDVNVLANDGDGDGDSLSVDLVAIPSGVTAAVLPSGEVRVTPAAEAFGIYKLRYRARDSKGLSSVSAPLTVTVAPQVRALVVVFDGNLRSRLVIAGTDLAGPQQVSIPASCNGALQYANSTDGRVFVGAQCGAGENRLDLIAARPRDTVVAPPVTLLANALLSPGLALTADGNRLFVVERTSDGDPSLPGNYDLVEIDVPAHIVTRRFPLTGYDLVYAIHPSVIGNRVFIEAHDPEAPAGFDILLLQIDTTSGAVVMVNEPGKYPVFFDTAPLSADGRFLGRDWGPDGNLYGYDLSQPGTLTTFWSAASGDYAYGESPKFVPGTSTLALRTFPANRGATSLWTVPLDGSGAPARLASYPTTYSSDLRLVVRAERLIYAADAAIYGNSHVTSIDLASRAPTTITPPDGLFLEDFGLVGTDSVWFSHFDEQQKRRLSLGRISAPGVIEPVAPEIDAYFYSSVAADPFGTALAFSTQATDVAGAYVVDVNLPARALRLAAGDVEQEFTYVLGVWGMQ